jgi:ATP-dependent Lon protease
MPEELLPLFPLQIVLLPNSVLPLHIFEVRYKQLIRECVKEAKAFGISLVQDNQIARIGCTAIVTEVVRTYDDGRMDILVQGQRRYSLLGLVATPALYSVGSVVYEFESDKLVNLELAAETIKMHNQLVALVYADKSYEIVSEVHGSGLSFKMAQKAGMELVHRQKLLESNSENERLEMLRQHFLQVLPKLKNSGEIERVAKNDGYIIN